MKALLFIFLLFCQNTYAEILLVPDNSVANEDYQSKCHKQGYICTQKYFFNEESNKDTPLFNRLIDSMDLNDSRFTSNLPNEVKNILQNEMISEEQLEMLVRLLTQTDEITKDSKAIKPLLSEMKYIQTTIPKDSAFDFSAESFVVYFKKPLSIEKYKKIKKSFLKIYSQEIHFNQFENSEPMIQGACENIQPHSRLENIKWKVASNNSCGWNDSFQQTSSKVSSHLSEHKAWYITAAILIGTAILASQYEVQLQ